MAGTDGDFAVAPGRATTADTTTNPHLFLCASDGTYTLPDRSARGAGL